MNCDIFAAIRKEHTTDDRILASVHACRRAASRRELRNRGQEPQSESVVTEDPPTSAPIQTTRGAERSKYPSIDGEMCKLSCEIILDSSSRR